MLDLATSFLASVARDPEALAIVDGDVRLSYSAWYGKISGLVAGLDALGLKPGDHLVTVLQNRWEAATLHWACQFTAIVVTPLNWRSTTEELDFCLQDAEAKVIVYEESFGIWKLDVATGRSSEIKLDIATDEKDNETEIETVSNEVDAFDLSPSGRRAVVSARGQILTIATEHGDITRVAPDRMASRNQLPKWSADGKYIAFVSDRSGRDEIWISDPEGKAPKKITDLDNEKGALVFSPDSRSLLYTAADKKLYNYTVADGRTTAIASSDIARIVNRTHQ